MITYEHTMPVGVLVLVLLLALPMAAYSAWKFLPRNPTSIAIALLHLLALAGIGWCLLLPGRKDALKSLLKPRFIIALDTSASMKLTPSDKSPDRWATAMEALKQPWVDAIGADCDIEVCPIGTELHEAVPLNQVTALTPGDSSTLLRDGLRQLAKRYSGLNVAGALLLSDGVDTREAFNDWAADERPFPIHTLRLEPAGVWQNDPDIRVDGVTTARRVTVGWKTELKVKVSGQGTRNQPVLVQLFENDKLLEEQPVSIPDEGGEQIVIFQVEHPKIGTLNYRVHLPPLASEKNTSDNENSLSVQVVDARNRLLYVEGTPRWEYKFLSRSLLADKQVSPIIFFTGPDGKPSGAVGDLSADMSPSDLSQCKIVVLGDLSAAELTEARAQNLVKFVEDGGSLVLLGGGKAWGAEGHFKTPLGKILPVRGTALETKLAKEPFPVQLTDTARSHPAFAGDAKFWEIVPPVLSVFSGVTLAPGAQVLVNAQTPTGPFPMVAAQRYGEGKVITILTDSLWRWQLGPEASARQPYQRFWTQLISWLLPQEQERKDQGIELTADHEQIYFGERIALQVRGGGSDKRAPDRVECTVTLPDHRQVPYSMNTGQIMTPDGKSFAGFTLPFTPETAGAYSAVAKVTSAGHSELSEPVLFFVQPFSPETKPRPIDAKLLATLSTASRGTFYESVADLNKGLASLEFKAVEEQTAHFETLWRNWLTVILLMVALASSWILRKLKNLP
jgi:hypothetical protein